MRPVHIQKARLSGPYPSYKILKHKNLKHFASAAVTTNADPWCSAIVDSLFLYILLGRGGGTKKQMTKFTSAKFQIMFSSSYIIILY